MDLLPGKLCLGGLSVDRLSQLDLAWPIFLRGFAVAIGKLDNPHFVGTASEFNRAFGFQFLHQVGHELEVELVNLDLELAGAHVLEAPAVSNAVLANVNA